MYVVIGAMGLITGLLGIIGVLTKSQEVSGSRELQLKSSIFNVILQHLSVQMLYIAIWSRDVLQLNVKSPMPPRPLSSHARSLLGNRTSLQTLLYLIPAAGP